MGVIMIGHSTYTAKPATIISRILAGSPPKKNSPVEIGYFGIYGLASTAVFR